MTTNVAQPTPSTVEKKTDVTLSTMTTSKNTRQTHEVTSLLALDKVSSSSPPPSTPSQTPKHTEETHPSQSFETTTTNQTSSETVSHRPSDQPGSESPKVTATTTLNATSPGQTCARAELFSLCQMIKPKNPYQDAPAIFSYRNGPFVNADIFVL